MPSHVDLIVEGASRWSTAPVRPGFVGDGRRVAAADRVDRSSGCVRARPADTDHRSTAKGSCWRPGFIDVHNHSDLGPLVDPAMPSTVRQGVTTVVVGNCGSSPWPPAGSGRMRAAGRRRPRGDGSRVPSFGGLPRSARRRAAGVNVAALVGHGAVRIAGHGRRTAPTDRGGARGDAPGGCERRCDEGALGLSTGLIYVPGMYARDGRGRGARAGGRRAEAASTRRTSAARASTCSAPSTRRSRSGGERERPGAREPPEVRDVVGVGQGRRPARPVPRRTTTSPRTSIPTRHGPPCCGRCSRRGRPWTSVARICRPTGRTSHAWSVRSRTVKATTFQSSVRGVGWDRIVIEATADAAVQRHEHRRRSRTRGDRAGRGVPPAADRGSPRPRASDTRCAEDDVRTILADPDVMVASDAVVDVA